MKQAVLLIIILTLCITVTAGARNTIMVSSVAEETRDGPDALLMGAVAQELNLTLHFRNAPFKRRLIMMEKGQLDMICGLLFRPARKDDIHFVHPPYKTRSDTIFFVRARDAGKIRSYEDLKGLKIGVNRGAKHFDRFDRDTTLTKETALTQNNFSKLLLGRLDTVIQDEANGIFLIHKLNAMDRIAMSPFRFSRNKEVFFGISRKSWMMAALDEIEPVLVAFIRSGRARDIITGYYTGQGLPGPAM